MEADFNITNKLIFGSRMIKNIEDRQGFPDELYGSRKNCSAIEVAISRRHTIDIIKQSEDRELLRELMRHNATISLSTPLLCFYAGKKVFHLLHFL